MSLSISPGRRWFGQTLTEQGDIAVTEKVIDGILQLPLSSVKFGSLPEFWEDLSIASRKNIFAVMKARRPEGYQKLLWLKYHYRFMAHPRHQDWPEPDSKDLLHEVYVGVAPIQRICYLVDGKKMVKLMAEISNVQTRYTFLEYETKYGLSVKHMMQTVGATMVRGIHEAKLHAEREPTLYSLSVASRGTKGIQAEYKTLLAYSRQQVDAYCNRMGISVLDMESHPVQFKDGRYQKKETP